MLCVPRKICQLFPLFYFLIELASAVEPGTKVLCPGWTLRGGSIPSFSDVEKRLICGDKEGDKVHPNDAWKTIPYPQAKFNLTNFLQERGYHHPVFTPKNLDRTEVDVDIGDTTRVKQVDIEGTSAPIEVQRMRKIVGSVLTPNVLGQLEKWVYERLRELGYGCPHVDMVANPDTGQVIVKVAPGSIQTIASVETEEVPGLREGVLRRYDAFTVGHQFNGTLLGVTENRVTGSKILDTNRFNSTCDADGVHLKQTTLAGKPRILTVKFGATTEVGPKGQVSWENTRFGLMGSQVKVNASGSFKAQTFSTSMNWYVLPYPSRFFLNPLISFTHTNLQQYETISAIAQIGPSGTWDFDSLGLDGFVGPTLNRSKTLQGKGAENLQLLSLETRLSVKSHTYEEFGGSPRAGYVASIVTDVNSKDIYSDISAQRISLRGEFLFNFKNYDPPLWIVGFRYGYSSTFVDTGALLTANLVQYLGGSQSIRGFGLTELPQNQDQEGIPGRLTSGFLGTELRLSNVMPFNLDPFVFLDLGALSYDSGGFDRPVYWSPGFGLRWASPIGPVRGTIAHGYGAEVNHFQYFVSLGEEF